MNDPVVQEIDMEPGGVLVVGPRGRFTMHRHASGKICVQAVHCDFVGPDGMSRAHKALVNERWALRTEDGLPILSEIQRHEQELAQERDKPEKRPEVAEKAEGHSAARSEGASDLPLWQGWLVVVVCFFALLAFAWPDLMAWWNDQPPVLFGGQP